MAKKKSDKIEDADVLERNPKDEGEEATASGSEETADKKTTDKEADPEKTEPKKKASSKKSTPTPEKDPGGSTTGENIKLNWGDNDDVVKSFISQPTKESTAEDAEAALANNAEGSAEDEAAYIRGDFDDEDGEDDMLDEKDLLLAAELVIELVDGLNSISVGAFAKESASKFELEASKKKKLALILAKVLYKYQAKVGPLATLILALLLFMGMQWRLGFEVRKEKKEEAEREAIAARKEKTRKRKEAMRNKIMAAIGMELITLKEISERMGENGGKIKPALQELCGMGLVFADHKKPIIHYKLAE